MDLSSSCRNQTMKNFNAYFFPDYDTSNSNIMLQARFEEARVFYNYQNSSSV